MSRSLAVIGGGWSGIAAAVDATRRGWQVSLFEMAPQLGGRARSLDTDPRLDNGQHILIGAYVECLRLMRQVGVDVDAALLRQPLALHYPDHQGLRLPRGPAALAFGRAVLGHSRWPWAARARLLLASLAWAAQGFHCKPQLTVAALCAHLPEVLQRDLVEPLCVAALNTPASEASAQVFLRVLRDALFQGPGASDLLLPRRPLGELLAEPAQAWLRSQGCMVLPGRRVESLQAGSERRWRVDDQTFERVVIACSAAEAARLAAPLDPAWSQAARALRFEPIITVYLRSPGSRLPAAMTALHDGPDAPAQFAFDLGQLGHAPGCFAFVISGASAWVERGLDTAGLATLSQARHALSWSRPPEILRVLAEKRATFACTPGLVRPPARLAPGLWVAGDYVAGPYPATLEGAVRSGLAAAAGLDSDA